MLEKRTLEAFLKDSTLNQSREELERALDFELDKPEEEMDTAFIAEATRMLLEMRGIPEEPDAAPAAAQRTEPVVPMPRRKTLKPWKFALIAAVICLVSVLSVATVSAAIFHVDILSNFVQIYKDHIQIDFGNSGQPTVKPGSVGKLAAELRMNGFTDVLLPSAFDKGYVMEDVQYDEQDDRTIASVRLRNADAIVTIELTKYDSLAHMEPINVGGNAEQVKEVDAGGVAVFVVDMHDYTSLLYANGSTSYSIETPYSMEQAIEIAEKLGL